MNTPQIKSPKENFRITNVVFLALLSGMFFILVAAYFVVSNNEYQRDDDLFNTLLIVNTIVSGLMIFLPRRFYEAAVKGFDKKLDLNSKIIHHRTQNIIRWAMIEASVLLAVVSTLVTGDLIFLAFALIMISFFYINKPAIEKFEIEYQLTSEEKNQLIL